VLSAFILADKRLGLLINFEAALIKDGITRIVNGLEDDSHASRQSRKDQLCLSDSRSTTVRRLKRSHRKDLPAQLRVRLAAYSASWATVTRQNCSHDDASMCGKSYAKTLSIVEPEKMGPVIVVAFAT
jgi:hypothetical protein